MDNLGVPKSVDNAVAVMHEAHQRIVEVIKAEKQSSCRHTEFVFLHPEYEENCKYCNLDACSIRKCKICEKVL